MRRDDFFKVPGLPWEKIVFDWPQHVKGWLYNPNSDREARFKLFAFMVRNGALPTMAQKYILWWIEKAPIMIKDPSAIPTRVRHVEEMISDWYAPDPARKFQMYRVAIWILALGASDKCVSTTKEQFREEWQSWQTPSVQLLANAPPEDYVHPEPLSEEDMLLVEALQQQEERDKELARERERAAIEDARIKAEQDIVEANERNRARRKRIVEAAMDRRTTWSDGGGGKYQRTDLKRVAEEEEEKQIKKRKN